VSVYKKEEASSIDPSRAMCVCGPGAVFFVGMKTLNLIFLRLFNMISREGREMLQEREA
jgi:hypothetical protein